MRLFFTFAFMLLVTVPLGLVVCHYFSMGWWSFPVGLAVGLVGANVANIVYDIFLKTWMQDDGN